jgi:hypothetical protein
VFIKIIDKYRITRPPVDEKTAYSSNRRFKLGLVSLLRHMYTLPPSYISHGGILDCAGLGRPAVAWCDTYTVKDSLSVRNSQEDSLTLIAHIPGVLTHGLQAAYV